MRADRAGGRSRKSAGSSMLKSSGWEVGMQPGRRVPEVEEAAVER